MTTTVQEVLNEIRQLGNQRSELQAILRSLATPTSNGTREVIVCGFRTKVPTDKLQRLMSDQMAATVMRLNTLEKHIQAVDKLLTTKIEATP